MLRNSYKTMIELNFLKIRKGLDKRFVVAA